VANRRRTTWEDRVLGQTLVAGAQLLIRVDGTNSVADSQGLTLTRVIIDMYLMSTSIAGAYGVQAVDYGVLGMSRESFAAGISPDPGSESEEPMRGWVVRNRVAVAQNGIGTPVTVRIQHDLHAQRRLDEGVIAMVFDNSNVLGTSASVLVLGLVRCLFLLP